jgi:hypothetical protein
LTASFTWFVPARTAAEQNIPPSVYQQPNDPQSATCTHCSCERVFPIALEGESGYNQPIRFSSDCWPQLQIA